MVKIVMKNMFKNFIPNGRTRAKLTVVCLTANFLIAILGLILKSDMSDLGTGLSLLNSPLYIYILGQSIRPSKVEVEEQIK
jgi:hypothetical protein